MKTRQIQFLTGLRMARRVVSGWHDRCPSRAPATDAGRVRVTVGPLNVSCWASVGVGGYLRVDLRCVSQPRECEWMLGSDVTTRLKWVLPPRNASECEVGKRVARKDLLHSKEDGGYVLPAFVQLVHDHLFSCKLVFLFLLLTDKTRKVVKAIYLLISVQAIFFRALWMAMFLSFYFSQQ